ncbi:MAG TPA: methyltransferase domain-containing protein [Chloroflexota bacterium]|nr:methyltransferase domain-containing protein [Chloroflexota bacterium]
MADALALPFQRGAFDIVLAAFSLNHLDDPAAGVREAGRVGNVLVASTYAADDNQPARAAVDQALSEVAWQRPPWYAPMKSAMAAWGTIDPATEVIERGKRGRHVPAERFGILAGMDDEPLLVFYRPERRVGVREGGLREGARRCWSSTVRS